MKAPLLATLMAMTLLSPAHAQTAPDTVGSALTGMISLLTLGSVSASGQTSQITHEGPNLRIQMPLSGFAAPSGAMAEAVARPGPQATWDIVSLSFPAQGAIGNSIDQVVSYSIGQQAIDGRIDPGFASRSTLTAVLRSIALHAASGDQETDQTIGTLHLDASLSPAVDGRVDLITRDTAPDLRTTTRAPGNVRADNTVQRLDGSISLTSVDRAQGLRLLDAARAWKNSASHRDLRAMLDTLPGLLSRFEATETLDGIAFDIGHGNAGTLGRMQIKTTGGSAGQRLNAGFDIAVDDVALTTMSPDTALFLPHQMRIRSAVAGLPVAQVLALLQAAIAANANPALLQQQATELLRQPGAQAAIESIDFDSGPLHLHGSARFVPRPDGKVGASIHLVASGADALLAKAQGKPALQGILPMVFLAKGLGRADGNSIVWDIDLGGGPPVINGMPFGQPSPARR